MLKRLLIVPVFIALPLAVSAESTEIKPGDLSNNQNRQSAEQKVQDAQKKKEQKQAELTAKKEQKKKERCEKASSVLTAKSEKVANKKLVIDQKLTTVENRWQRLIDRADSKNVDAAKLEEALKQFKGYHATFNTDMEALRKLQGNTTKACGEDSDAANLKAELRDAHTKVLQDAKQLRTFRQQTQKDVIVPLLKEMAKASSTSDDSTKDKTETETPNNTGATQ